MVVCHERINNVCHKKSLRSLGNTMYINSPILKALGFIVGVYTILPYSIFTRDAMSLYGVRLHEFLLIPFIVLSPALVLSSKVRVVVVIFSAAIAILIGHSLLLGQTIFNTTNNLREIAWFFLGIILGRGVRGEVSMVEVVKAYVILSIFYAIYIFFGVCYFGAYLGDYTEERLIGENPEDIRLAFDGLIALLFLWVYILNYSLSANKLVLALIPTLILALFVYVSGSRTLILALILVLLLELRGRAKYLAFAAIVSATCLVVQYGVNRFNIDAVLVSWGARNGPFINELTGMSLFNLAIGKGIGQSIYIPWFETIGLNPEARNLDGLYQTLLIKIGLIGLIVFLLIYMVILLKLNKSIGVLPRAFSRILHVQLLMAITTSYLFSATSIFYGLTIGMSLALISGDLASNNSNLCHRPRSGPAYD